MRDCVLTRRPAAATFMSHLPDQPHTPPTPADHAPAVDTGHDTSVVLPSTSASGSAVGSTAPGPTGAPVALHSKLINAVEAPSVGGVAMPEIAAMPEIVEDVEVAETAETAETAEVAEVAEVAETAGTAGTAEVAKTAEVADNIEPAAVEALTEASGDTSASPASDTATAVVAGTAGSAPALPRVADLSPAACADLLKRHFPALFTGPPKPLKLRIQQDIQQRTPGVFSKGSLGAFFRRYTGSTGYLIALGKSSQRFDLDGQPAGELSEEHRGLAREELARRRQLGRDRDQAAQALQQAAQAQQQAAQTELLQARHARLALLRDFERTTLTLANFCALKGLTPETLTPQLEQAKREAAEAPPPRPLDDRRGPPGPRRDDRNDPRPEGRRDARPPSAARGEGQADGRGNAGGDARGNAGDARGDNRRDTRDTREPRSDPRAAPRAEGRPDNRPQAPRPPGRPGGRPGGR